MLLLLMLAGVSCFAGCSEKASGPKEYSEEEAKAQLQKLLEQYPQPEPDTPEQIQQKEATVAKEVPEVYELLEGADTDPIKIDEAVELSMSLVALVPNSRPAIVAYCKAQLASFLAKEVIGDGGKMLDQHTMALAIRSACSEADRLRELVDDLSDDEVQLCRDVYFHRARLEGFYPHGDGANEIFKASISKLVDLGFRDVERVRAEPRFAYYFNNPETSPALEAAIAQMEALPAADAVPDAPTEDANAEATTSEGDAETGIAEGDTAAPTQ